MIALLQAEEQQDLETKQTCEEDRMANSRKAIVDSRSIDDKTDEITSLTAKIADCEAKIKELQAERKQTNEELKKATKMRKEENADWKQTDSDDKLAAETVLNAKKALQEFYTKNKLGLVQKAGQPVTPSAGEAPP